MEIKDYQTIIKHTAVYPKEVGIAYCVMGLTGEAGEVAEKIKKLYRDKDLLNKKEVSEEDKKAIAKELGDVIWYVTALASELDISLEGILQMNYDKLTTRRSTNTLHGSGDNREEI